MPPSTQPDRRPRLAWTRLLHLLGLAPLLLATSLRADSVVVFNEIMYHPLTNEAALEWVELHNQMAVDVELTGWSIDGGIEYAFPDGTILPGGGYLVVAVSPADLFAATGATNILGPFDGRLANDGESLELRNNNDRLMDEVDYGVEGDWPTGPDGAGVSLAKYDPATASAWAVNWRVSAQFGGTPGVVNFPSRRITLTQTNAFLIDSVWTYDDSGQDLGTTWREPGFDDGAWPAGAGLLHAGTDGSQVGQIEPIPTLFNTGVNDQGTPLAAGSADPHYLLTISPYSTPPPPPIAATVTANHPAWLANDASSMWLGPVSQGTTSVPQGGYHYRTYFSMSGFDASTARLEIQVAADNEVLGVVLNDVNLGINYVGFNAWSPLYTQTSGLVSGVNILDFVTTNYPGTGDNPAGFRAKVSGTALKYAPNNTLLTLGPTTHYFRKSFVLDGNPTVASLRLRPVVDDGAVFYLNGVEVLRLNMPGGPITAATPASTNVDNPTFTGPFNLPTGSLLSGDNVLAVELHQAADGLDDLLFGAELDLTVTNLPPSPPPTLAFNEISSVTNAQFEIELLNFGGASVELDGFVLARFGTFYAEYPIPNQTLAPGEYLVFERATLGFGADPGDRVVLYGAGKTTVIDALVAKRYPRARLPEGTGPWLHPDQPTFGAPNHFTLHEEVVINEIMYHQRDLPPTPNLYFTNSLLTLSNTWSYNQTGLEPDPNWLASDYDDSAWLLGKGLFHTNFTSLPGPMGTLLDIFNDGGQGIIAYYFRAPFVLTNDPANIDFTLNHIVDDGAVFYLNGVEFLRYGMPAGAISSTTRATYNIGVPTNAGPYTIPSNLLVQGTNVMAVEVHQYFPPPLSRDICFGAQLVASGLLSPAQPARRSPESWLELHNRGTNTVDLTGWRLDEGISYDFPAGQTIAPGGYLVVAKDPVFMQGLYPSLDFLGPFDNRISRSSDLLILRDAAGNPADQVRYFDDWPWPDLPDGGGSSLELRDPRADNTKPEAWAASDETGQTEWQTYTYQGTAAAEPASSPTQWNEFILGLVSSGEVLIDNVSVIEAPGSLNRQLIQNGSFETGPTAWRIIGNHSHSRVIVDPDNPGNHVLHLVATGPSDHMHNHAETTLANGATTVNGTEYLISFRARWLAGGNQVLTRLYFNRLPKVTALPVPIHTGTPGAPNSRYEPNLGPTFSDLAHAPVVPTANQPVTVSVTADDPDGVSQATLWWSANGGTWNATFMDSPGLGLFQANLPGYADGTVVQFYVEATDFLGAISTYPAGGRDARALYKVGLGVTPLPGLHTVRIIMTPADANLLHAPTNVMSNDRLGCTVISNDEKVFYDVGLHLQGSERGRNVSSRVGFTVRFHTDDLFRGVQDSITVDRSGGYSGLGGRHDEILVKHAINRAGNLPGMYDDLVQCYAPRNAETSTGLLIMAKYGDLFLDSQFQDGSDGELYKLELIYYPTTTLNGDVQSPKLPQPDNVVGTDIRDLGSDKNDYRWVLLKENNYARDNYYPMMELAQAMSLSGAALEDRIEEVMDVDEWMRAVAFLALIGSNDMYTYGNSHNLLIYFRPSDQKGMAFLWDMDYELVASITAAFPGTGSATTYRLITTIPNNYRRYYNHLYHLSGITGDAAYMGDWASRYAGLLGQDWGGMVNWLSQRATFVRGNMPVNTPFAITTNNGNDFTTTNSQVNLTGTAPINVRDIHINGIPFPITWSSLTQWTLTVPLPAAVNHLQTQGVDNDGNPIPGLTDSITVTNTGVPPLQPVVINEWMADNAGPGGFPDPADNLFQDWFELFNPNLQSVNLGGYYLTDDFLQPTKYTIPDNTVIAAQGFLLAWADENGSQNGTNPQGDLHVNFKLSAGGESIGLYAPDGTPQHLVVFGAQTQNISQGLYPDGDTNAVHTMPNWTPRAPNQLGNPPVPDIGPVTLSPDGTLSFTCAAQPGRAYQIEFTDQLEAPLWTPLGIERAVDTTLTITDSTAGIDQRFYRVVLLP